MKKLLCAILVFIMTATLCAPVAAVETESTFVPETFTREELLAMDPELDSDGDGLVDVIELVYEMNRYHPDTDGDGVSDYTEFCITCTDPLTPDGHLDTDGDGLTNAQEAVYGTNPDDLDTDNDNLGDYDEIMVYHTDPLVKDNINQSLYGGTESEHVDSLFPNPQASTFARPGVDIIGPGEGGSDSYLYNGTLHTEYDGVQYTSSVGYTIYDYWFFSSSSNYNKQIATTSALLSTIAYDMSYLDNVGTTNATHIEAVQHWFTYHGFIGYDRCDLDYMALTNTQGYQDQHVSEMFYAYKTVTYNGKTKNLLCVVVRGTNETLDEWQSNFDVGSTADYGSTSGWRNAENHMGFDITANRLNDRLNAFMSRKGFDSSNTIIWITGHSRGAALANIMAAEQIDAGYDVFAYCFATPGTTTSDDASATKYNSIFNIINEDDLVPQLPMSAWEFKRYGVNKPGSIENSYAGQWDAMVSGNVTYTSNKTNTANLVATMANIADGRDECYVYRNTQDGRIYVSMSDYTACVTAYSATVVLYPANTQPYWYSTISVENTYPYFHYYAIYQQPAFLMQYMAYAMQEGFSSDISFFLASVAPYLSEAKTAIVSASSTIKHPHYLESYYILACNLS